MKKKNIFALLRTFVFAALLPALSLSLVSCEPEGGDEGGCSEGDGSVDTTSEIAVTGLVDAYGCGYADISGYANLNLLPAGSGDLVIGVEVVKADAENNDDAIQSTAASLIGNIFTVSFRNLEPATEYKYRSFVAYGGITYYGSKYKTFTTKGLETGAVDLGLSVKWAGCNVGADSPEDYGDYFAWGETVTKSDYNSSNSVISDLSTSELMSRGIIGSGGNLTAEYDAATANWGSPWRMPTLGEIKELIEDCTWEWTSVNGVKGRLVTGPNGNSIFLPAAGYRRDTSLRVAGNYGNYWSATPYSTTQRAYYLEFTADKYIWYDNPRLCGRSVRPVSE